MKMKQIYQASDGKEFDTSEAAKAHEAELGIQRLCGLTQDQVQAAVAYTDKDLATAIEAVARRIYVARGEAGDVKRRTPKEPGAVVQPARPIPCWNASPETSVEDEDQPAADAAPPGKKSKK